MAWTEVHGGAVGHRCPPPPPPPPPSKSAVQVSHWPCMRATSNWKKRRKRKTGVPFGEKWYLWVSLAHEINKSTNFLHCSQNALPSCIHAGTKAQPLPVVPTLLHHLWCNGILSSACCGAGGDCTAWGGDPSDGHQGGGGCGGCVGDGGAGRSWAGSNQTDARSGSRGDGEGKLRGQAVCGVFDRHRQNPWLLGTGHHHAAWCLYLG